MKPVRASQRYDSLGFSPRRTHAVIVQNFSVFDPGGGPLLRAIHEARGELAQEMEMLIAFSGAIAGDLQTADQLGLVADLKALGRLVNKINHKYCGKAVKR
jgi:hypothetical protein